MKKVNASWLQVKKEPVYSTLEALMENNKYVGFTSHSDFKYFLTYMDQKIYAVRPSMACSPYQNAERGDYFIFDTEKELLTWMIGE